MLRTWLRRLGNFTLLLLAIPLGASAAVGGFFALAFITSMIPALMLSGALALALQTGWLSRRACRRLFARPLWRHGLPLVITGGTLLVVGIVASVHVFQPMTFTYAPKEATPQTVYWDLPTGSRLAYVLTPAVGAPQPTPVIMLHGGPGASGDFTLQPADQRLAAAGFDVYQYDQVGAGLSERLDDITQYRLRGMSPIWRRSVRRSARNA